MVPRKFIVVVLVLGVLFGAKTLWEARQKSLGFTLSQISSNLPYHPEWAVASDSSVLPILSQKFTYLAEGAQAYAFESEDGKYVLKFFKMRRFTPSLTDYLCPQLYKLRLKNLRWVFNGHKIAYSEFSQDTGMVFIHLNKTRDLHKQLTVIDQNGKELKIDLDRTEFIVQEKAELIFDRLKKLGSKEQEKAIASVLALVKRRVAKGYADRDKAVSNNYGFVGDRPIHLDVGRLHYGNRPGQVEHVERRISRWQVEGE